MTDLPFSDLKTVLARAGALAIALRSFPQSNPVPVRIAELIQKDIVRLSAALRENDMDAAETALAFPSIDARAADGLGGFYFSEHTETSEAYMALLRAIVSAREKLEADSP